MRTYIFQQSRIFEGGDLIDPTMPEVKVKVYDLNTDLPSSRQKKKQKMDPITPEIRARRQLPKPELGRKWILLRVE